MNDFLVKRLYETRQAAKSARQARSDKRMEVGDCQFKRAPYTAPCYVVNPDVWCPACAAMLPCQREFRAASNRAAAALRAALREGKRLSKRVATPTVRLSQEAGGL